VFIQDRGAELFLILRKPAALHSSCGRRDTVVETWGNLLCFCHGFI